LSLTLLSDSRQAGRRAAVTWEKGKMAAGRGGVDERVRWRRGGDSCHAGGEAGADPEAEAEGDGVGERGGRGRPWRRRPRARRVRSARGSSGRPPPSPSASTPVWKFADVLLTICSKSSKN
ncbi:Os11g0591400, partial [Oryza sativa Japonica Group]